MSGRALVRLRTVVGIGLALAALACREPVASASASSARPGSSSVGPSASARAKAAAGGQRIDARAGETVELRARHADGVPLHPEPRTSAVSGRLPDGTRAVVLEVRDEGRWLKVRAPNGVEGWITRRYVGGQSQAPASRSRAPGAGAKLDPRSPWSSRAACLSALQDPERPRRPEGVARMAAWNVRWFPEGAPGLGGKRGGTDLVWLACALALLDADVIVLSEIKAHPRGRTALNEVLARLGELTGGTFHARLDECQPAPAQHVAIVWNGARVRAHGFEVYGELNPRGAPCRDQLRPGLGGYFRFPGGLDVEVVGVHLKSGADPRALALRQKSWEAFASVRARVGTARKDDDIVVLGDFNAMGCRSCSPALDAAGEREKLARSVPGFVLPPAEPACSHYYDGRGALLDFAITTSTMREARNARVSVEGLCRELGCFVGDALPDAYHRLSDHCPVVLDVVDRDWD
ncbi:MAG: endonuclease/exonuclease/phosphatase family protein [Pseudomonadota bacterium]